MPRICYSCKLQENNFAGKHWKPGAPVTSDGPRCRQLSLVPVRRGYREDTVVKNQLLCSYCRDPNIFRIASQYSDLPQYRSIAKRLETAKGFDIIDIEVVKDFDAWSVDGTTCATVSFKIGSKTFIFDFQAAGPKGYAMFEYAHDSDTARKNVLEFIHWWVKAISTRNWD